MSFINAEWGVTIDLFPQEDQFKQMVMQNLIKLNKGPVVTFRDILSLIKKKLDLKNDDGRMIRFLDADNLRIITKSDYLIYERPEDVRSFAGRTFMI